MTTLPDNVKAFIDERTFAVLATNNADGSPQTTVHWSMRDGDDILMSTVKGRRHARNLERDQRVSVLVLHPGNPYVYVEVRGTATLTEEDGRAVIDDLFEKYRGVRPAKDNPEFVRLAIRVRPEHVVIYPSR